MDWGVPDFRDASAYGDTQSWPLKRWRWEFTRRRPDFRADFLAAYEQTYEAYCEGARDPGNTFMYGAKVIAPGEPGFAAETTVQQLEKYGCELLDPRVSDHGSRLTFYKPEGRNSMAKGEGSGWDAASRRITLAEGVRAFSIDLDKPLAAQLTHIEWLARELQKERHGKLLERRRRKDKWLEYLQVIDARDAGLSDTEVYDQVLAAAPSDDPARKNEAQKVRERATALQFNFPD